MGRSKRQWVSQLVGSFHIISRVAGSTGSDFILQEQELAELGKKKKGLGK